MRRWFQTDPKPLNYLFGKYKHYCILSGRAIDEMSDEFFECTCFDAIKPEFKIITMMKNSLAIRKESLENGLT